MAFIILVVMLAVIIFRQSTLLQEVDCTMATVAEIKETLTSVASGVDGLEAAIADLKRQVAAGGVVSQADLDSISEQASAIAADIADVTDQE